MRTAKLDSKDADYTGKRVQTASERQASALCEGGVVFFGGRDWAAVGNIFFDGFADGGDFGDGAQYGFATFNAVDAASDSECGIAGAAVLEIVEDEDFEGDLGSWADSVKMVRSSDGITVVPMPSETAAVQAFVPDDKIGYNIGHQCPTY
ncbi:TPA: hypothetical protein WI035_000586 [Neisseria meningitidis]|nr:hypothetical protein [Neisseria meningitidis]MBG9200955.1 hypothetical protein [Neisseria meningitidis]